MRTQSRCCIERGTAINGANFKHFILFTRRQYGRFSWSPADGPPPPPDTIYCQNWRSSLINTKMWVEYNVKYNSYNKLIMSVLFETIFVFANVIMDIQKDKRWRIRFCSARCWGERFVPPMNGRVQWPQRAATRNHFNIDLFCKVIKLNKDFHLFPKWIYSPRWFPSSW